MHFIPFYRDPKNVLLSYRIPTGGIPISYSTNEFLCGLEDVSEQICKSVRSGTPYHIHTRADGTKCYLAWSEEQQQIVFSQYQKVL